MPEKPEKEDAVKAHSNTALKVESFNLVSQMDAALGLGCRACCPNHIKIRSD
jgi:hypothetical protein